MIDWQLIFAYIGYATVGTLTFFGILVLIEMFRPRNGKRQNRD